MLELSVTGSLAPQGLQLTIPATNGEIVAIGGKLCSRSGVGDSSSELEDEELELRGGAKGGCQPRSDLRACTFAFFGDFSEGIIT